MKMYHASKHNFFRPIYEEICINRTGHANGLLGLWVSAKDDWIENFGSNIYEVAFDGNVTDISVSELSAMGTNLHGEEKSRYFKKKRLELLRNGVDYLRLIEDGGNSAMGIILNFKCIETFTLRTA